MSRRNTSIAAAACLVVFLAASVFVLHHSDKARPQSTLEEVLYISSPRVLKRASLGYSGLLADIYWTRAVQYFGVHQLHRSKNFGLLAPLLEITTQLDPHLVVAYEFGASFLAPAPPEGAGEPERAVDLMQYGIQNNPGNWRLYYDLGFVYSMNLKDYKGAAEAFEKGSQLPDAHPWLRLMAAQMAEHGGDVGTARMMWTATYQNSTDDLIKKNAEAHLKSLRVDEDVKHLDELVSGFRSRTGRNPASIAELASAAGLRGLPADPEGKPYKITSDGRVEVRDPDDFPFATEGLPPGYKPAPKFR
jgi:tetratricopeptide (TPR) repeat protein